MFKKNTLVAWTTRSRSRGNDYTGRVVSSNDHSTIVKVTSTSRPSKEIGKSFSVSNVYLGDISSGKTRVIKKEKTND